MLLSPESFDGGVEKFRALVRDAIRTSLEASLQEGELTGTVDPAADPAGSPAGSPAASPAGSPAASPEIPEPTPRAEPSAKTEPYDLAIAATATAIGLLANGFPDSERFLDQVEQNLLSLSPDLRVHRFNKGNASVLAGDQLLDGISAECRAVVTAYGH